MTMTFGTTRKTLLALGSAALIGSAMAVPAVAQYRQELPNDLSRCSGNGPAVRVQLSGVSASSGIVRVQAYRGVASDWMQKGRWLSRIEAPARAGTMTFCVPVPGPGTYAIAVRHDLNGNGKTDLRSDGGGMSNNPSINIFNLGRPPVSRTAFSMGDEVRAISITMRYM
ncbi:MAG TPA: DUF2141 domain-containing protein [Novosphingobium sp.]|nr:DUF2141 domain-containing protein [Novosphingobium sp.]